MGRARQRARARAGTEAQEVIIIWATGRRRAVIATRPAAANSAAARSPVAGGALRTAPAPARGAPSGRVADDARSEGAVGAPGRGVAEAAVHAAASRAAYPGVGPAPSAGPATITRSSSGAVARTHAARAGRAPVGPPLELGAPPTAPPRASGKVVPPAAIRFRSPTRVPCRSLGATPGRAPASAAAGLGAARPPAHRCSKDNSLRCATGAGAARPRVLEGARP